MVDWIGEMVLAEYLHGDEGLLWDYARQAGIQNAVVRAPDKDFNLTAYEDWAQLKERYLRGGFSPCVLEPVPESLYCHIKTGDFKRDESIEVFIKMLAVLDRLDIRTICANFMAYTGWYRTASRPLERGGAIVTEFDHRKCPDRFPVRISHDDLWKNLAYFLKAVVPELERYHIRLAFHPDDPPVEQLGDVQRILTSSKAMDRVLALADSDAVGITLCQGCFAAMGEDIEDIIQHYGTMEKIFFVHFRDIQGNRNYFRETFHDNGMTSMAKAIMAYKNMGFRGPVRVDHVPTMAGEDDNSPGYGKVGRLFAVGYLKGLLEASGYACR